MIFRLITINQQLILKQIFFNFLRIQCFLRYFYKDIFLEDHINYGLKKSRIQDMKNLIL